MKPNVIKISLLLIAPALVYVLTLNVNKWRNVERAEELFAAAKQERDPERKEAILEHVMESLAKANSSFQSDQKKEEVMRFPDYFVFARDTRIKWQDYCRLRIGANLKIVNPIFRKAMAKNEARKKGPVDKRNRLRPIWNLADQDVAAKVWWHGNHCYDRKNPVEKIYLDREKFFFKSYRLLAELTWHEIVVLPASKIRVKLFNLFIKEYLERGGTIEDIGIPRRDYDLAKRLVLLEELIEVFEQTVIIPRENGVKIEQEKAVEIFSGIREGVIGAAAMRMEIRNPDFGPWFMDVSEKMVRLGDRAGGIAASPGVLPTE